MDFTFEINAQVHTLLVNFFTASTASINDAATIRNIAIAKFIFS